MKNTLEILDKMILKIYQICVNEIKEYDNKLK